MSPSGGIPFAGFASLFYREWPQEGSEESANFVEQKLDKFGEQACAKLGELELSWTKM